MKYSKEEILQMIREQHEKDLDSLIEWLDRNLPPFNRDKDESE